MRSKSLQPTQLSRFSLALASALAGGLLLPSTAQAQNLAYYNLLDVQNINNTGFYSANNGSSIASGARTTNLIADDIRVADGYGGLAVSRVTATVYMPTYTNETLFQPQARMRFWAADGVDGGPGTFLSGLTQIISLASNTRTDIVFTASNSSQPLFVLPTNGRFWAGITFDGGTTYTDAQMNRPGLVIPTAAAVGSSTNQGFRAPGSGGNYLGVNNPSGTYFTFNGLTTNFTWAVETFTAPTSSTGASGFLGPVVNPASGNNAFWGFDVPDGTQGGKLMSTKDTNLFTPSGTTLRLNVTGATGFYGGGVYQKNVVNTTLSQSNIPADWFFETSLRANFSGANDYPFAGLAVIGDSENVLEFTLAHSPANGANNNYASVRFLKNGVYTEDSLIPLLGGFTTANDANQWTLRIAKNSQNGLISFFYNSFGGPATQLLGSLSPTDIGVRADMYTFLNSIGGKRVGLITANQSSTTPGLHADFEMFNTNINLAPLSQAAAPEPGTILLVVFGAAITVGAQRRKKN